MTHFEWVASFLLALLVRGGPASTRRANCSAYLACNKIPTSDVFRLPGGRALGHARPVLAGEAGDEQRAAQDERRDLHLLSDHLADPGLGRALG